MKKIFTLSFAFAAMLAGSTTAWADDYPTNYSASDNSIHEARYTKSLTVAVDGEETVIDLASAAYGPLYYDKTSVEVAANPGSSIQLTGDFQDSWMHAYAYVDMDNDGQFSYEVDETNHTALSTSDLRVFSFYSFNSTSDESGYNSEGTPISGNNRSDWTLAPFTAPTTAGTYRVRYKIDWNNIDPAGATNSSLWGSMQANGGVIVDFTLKVGNGSIGLSVPYSINFDESQEGWTAIDESETPGSTWAYNARGFYDSGSYYGCVAMTRDYSSTYNDYYVSPAISLKAGKTYEVKTLAFADGSNAVVKLCKGTSDTDMTDMTEIATLTTPDSYDASAEETHEVTVEADGDYYFAFLGTTLDLYTPQFAYLMSFSIDEKSSVTPVDPTQDEATLPYSISFGETQEGWTAADNNADGSTWTAYSGIGIAIDNNEVDDDYISPLFSLEAGKTYTITTKVQGANVNEAAQLSILAGTSKESLSEVKSNMTVPASGEQVEETTFTPSESGKYCFALREVITYDDANAYTMPLYLVSFAIEEAEETEEEGTPVFSSDFTGENPAEGWTVSDANKDNVTWTASESGLTYDSNAAQGEANDWLATSAFKVVDGHDYIVDITFEQSGAFDPDKVNIHWGSSNLDVEPTTIADEELYAENGQGTISKSYRITADFTGNAYVGVRLYTSEPNGTLTLTSLVVTPVAKAVPQPVTDLSGEVNSDDKTVTLTWTNPSTDTKSLPISGMLKANIYQGSTLLATTDALTPGEETSYVISPSTFAGETTFVVKAVIEEKESEGTSVTVNLDDVSGVETLVKEFDVNRNSASDWVIENIAGTSEWKYDYSNVFRFDFQNGQKNDNDWLISPAVELEKGVRYIAKYELKTARDYATSVDVTLGNKQNSAAQTQVIASHPSLKQNGFAQFETAQFSVSETGNYYVGFHVFSADYAVSMCNLAIYSVGTAPTAIETAESAAALSYDARTATLSIPMQAGAVNVYDLQGRLTLHTTSGQATISLATLPSGVYVVKTASQSIKIAK